MLAFAQKEILSDFFNLFQKNCCIFSTPVLQYISAQDYCANFIDSKSEEVFGLPNIKSAKKRVLVSQTKAMQNKAAKSAL